MLYVIYGTERFLMDQRLDKLKKQYQCEEDLMNYSYYNLQEDDMQSVLEDVMMPPFLSDNKMIVVTHCDFLTTKKGKKDNPAPDLLLKCLDYLDAHVHLVIFHDEKNFDERKKIVKTLRKEAEFYDINTLTHYKVSDTVRKAIKSRNCTIDDDALELLLDRKGLNLIDLINEVEKLCLYSQHIDRDAVDALVSKPLEEDVFILTNALLERDKDKMFSIYKDLMVLNEEPVKLLVMIGNAIRLQYQVKLLDRKGYNNMEIGKLLSINPKRVNYIRRDGQKFQIDELLKYLDELSQLDVQIKTGKIDKYLALELFMLRI